MFANGSAIISFCIICLLTLGKILKKYSGHWALNILKTSRVFYTISKPSKLEEKVFKFFFETLFFTNFTSSILAYIVPYVCRRGWGGREGGLTPVDQWEKWEYGKIPFITICQIYSSDLSRQYLPRLHQFHQPQ